MMESTSAGRPAQMMSFNDAVTNCLINNYMDFNGRASRSEYWFWYLFSFIISIFTTIIDGYLFGWEVTDPTWVSFFVGVSLWLPWLGVIVRRLHDVGRSGWWFLILFTIIGIIPLFIWACMEGDANPNEYGEVPTNTIARENGINYNNY
jgi:uncharacterized membrane protein YhaH (DUF805 family)